MIFLEGKRKVLLIQRKIKTEKHSYRDEYEIIEQIDFANIAKSEKKSLAEDEIIVIGEDGEWYKIARVLEEKGYVVWKDFIPEWIFQIISSPTSFTFRKVSSLTGYNAKKMGEIFEYISKYKPIAGVYGNCQSIFISKIMQNTDVLKKKYIFCEFPFVQDMKEEAKKGFAQEYMKYFSLFIYQNVSVKNNYGKKLATKEFVLETLNSECEKVSIPFVYFKGYFPQHTKNTRNGNDNICPYGDTKLQMMCEDGVVTEEILKRVRKKDLFSKEEIRENLNETIEELKQREEKCDIQILDYILDNYQSEYLFYSPTHPTNLCLKELVRRICIQLGYKEFSIDLYGIAENDIVICCIYPSVREELQLSFKREKFRFNRKMGYEDTLEEYVKKYIEYNYKEFNEEICGYRTMDIRYMLELNNKLVSERIKGSFTICGKILHINMYLNVEAECKGVIMKIKQRYAPRYTHISYVCTVQDGKTFPIFLKQNGEFEINSSLKKGEIIVLDTSWSMK